MKIFLAGTSLLPAYGGPARSVSSLGAALTGLGVEVGLWTPDQSAAVTPFLSNTSTVQRLIGSDEEALDKFGDTDILHDNGMWLRHNHRLAALARARRIPRVVSTRGMLEPWALNHKSFKKRIAWSLYQRRDLKHASCHHTTADTEAHNLRRLGLDVPVRVIPNGVDIPDFKPSQAREKVRQADKKRTALFLGRIYPVKGLPMLVKAWSNVRPDGWVLQIAGPDEAGHRKQVEALVAAAGLRSVISFTGPVENHAKHDLLFDADLFVMPSYSESFGMAIAEALAHGVPVMATTGAPWPLLAERRCGWWVDPTVDGIASGLREATSLDSAALRTMGAKGRELVAAEFGWECVAKQFVVMYEDLIA